jgi:hypothetical protein
LGNFFRFMAWLDAKNVSKGLLSVGHGGRREAYKVILRLSDEWGNQVNIGLWR